MTELTELSAIWAEKIGLQVAFKNICSWKASYLISHQIKRHLLLGRKIANIDSVLKSRDIALPTKVYIVKAMFFPVPCTDVRAGQSKG